MCVPFKILVIFIWEDATGNDILLEGNQHLDSWKHLSSES